LQIVHQRQGYLLQGLTAPDGEALNRKRTAMPRKPNYNFERSQREKSKAAKKAERLRLKAEKSAARKAGADDAPTEGLEE